MSIFMLNIVEKAVVNLHSQEKGSWKFFYFKYISLNVYERLYTYIVI